MTDTPIETLLRSHPITDGTIQLSILNGQWMCTIGHRPPGHMTHTLGRFHDDPVEALRVTLIEDERYCRETARKYAAAPKVEPVEEDDFGALLG